MGDEKYWLGLKLVPEASSHLSKLFPFFGSAKKIWQASAKELVEVRGLSLEIARKIVAARDKVNPEEELAKLREKQVRLITLKSAEYPLLLRQTYQPPPILFVRGKPLSDYSYCLAIVGARKCSLYGRAVAEELAQELSGAGVTVASGLARGIDSVAHKGALRDKGSTVGVLGCGLDVVYPPENKRLYSEIAEFGSLVSEYPLGTLPLPFNFPSRNRIISGISLGVVVVEAKERSGTLITADFALEEGKEVMAIPGSVKSSLSKGTHRLLKQGAALVENAADVLEVLGLEARVEGKDKSFAELSSKEQQIIDIVSAAPLHIDEIARAAQLDLAEVLATLTSLEMNGLVKADAGKKYLKICDS